MSDPLQPPSSVHDDPGLGPKGPWSFLKGALSGGFSLSGLWLLGGWLFMALVPAFLWASYLMAHTAMGDGWSSLPAHWGEQLNAKDLVELFDRGEIHGVLGFGAATALLIGLVWILWASWSHQAEAAGHQPRLRPWLGGALDALILAIPIVVAYVILMLLVGWVGDLGIPTLHWFSFLGKPFFALVTFSVLMVQWWLLRLNRLDRGGKNWFEHVGVGFLRLWSHPVQWFTLVGGLALLRLLLHAGVLDLAWRLGGGTVGRVWLFVLFEGTAALLGAWLLGWMLRTVALFWNHDRAVRLAIAELKASSTGPDRAES